MKRRLSLAAVVVLILGIAPMLRAQRLFEGTITYRVTPASGTPVEVILRSNGKKLREDMRASGTGEESTSYQVIDGESGDVLVVIPAAKEYMVHHFKQSRVVSRDSVGSRTRSGLADILATGHTETIAGLPCEVYVRNDQPGGEWCLTTALGRLGAFDDQLTGSNAMSGAAMQLFKNGALVLRMTTGTASGHPMTIIATKVDRTPPPASLFRPPIGFKELKNAMVPNP